MQNTQNVPKRHVDHLLSRFPALKAVKQDILKGVSIFVNCFKQEHKLLVAGNGGSAADSEHITGELMKSFRKARPIEDTLSEKLKMIDSAKGEKLSQKLERGLMTIPLVDHAALATAYANDVDSTLVFAQQLLGFGRSGDVLLAISTSGNSQNVVYAALLAKALDIKVVGLTGADGGELASYSDVCVRVPHKESYLVQEYHLPIYHCWCMMLEEYFFGCLPPESSPADLPRYFQKT